MFDTVFGLPVHVLVLHFAVVLVPLAALATIAVAVRPAWLPRFGVWVAALDAVMVVLVWATKESGEKLLKRIYPDPSARPAAMRTHIERGDDLLWYAVALFVVAAALVVVARLRARGQAAIRDSVPAFVVPVVAVLAVAAAVLVTVQVVRTGHAGSQVVWKPIVQSTNG
ncbi:MAG: hypothetical protein HOV66_01170 [Streptomycetaceae bacterium]|nr:hypothetical protein [Streptomycetaceae bacterium]